MKRKLTRLQRWTRAWESTSADLAAFILAVGTGFGRVVRAACATWATIALVLWALIDRFLLVVMQALAQLR